MMAVKLALLRSLTSIAVAHICSGAIAALPFEPVIRFGVSSSLLTDFGPGNLPT